MFVCMKVRIYGSEEVKIMRCHCSYRLSSCKSQTQFGVVTHPLLYLFLAIVYHSITTTITKPSRLVGVGQTTHTGHHAQHVVVHGIHAHLGRTTRAHCVDGHRQLEGRLVDTGEVAGAAGLVLLGLQREGIHVDTHRRRASVVLVRLHTVEVATLALREAVLAVQLQLGNLHGVLAGALDTRVQHHLGQQVVGGLGEHLVARIGRRVQPRRTHSEGRALHDAHTRQVRTGRTIASRGRHGDRGGTTDQRATGQHIHHDTLRAEVIGVVEGLAAVHLSDEVLVGRAVHEGVTLDNPHQLLHGVVEVQLDLVAGAGDALSASELQLLDQVLVSLLGEAATLLRVQVHVVNVQGRSRQGLDGGGRGRGTRQLVVAAVDPLLELHVDAHLVVLQGDQGDGQTRVAAEPELQRDVQGLRGRARARGAAVGQLGTSARGIQGIATLVLHQHQVVGVTDHVIQSLDGTRILGQLGPDLEPVTILAVDALTTDLQLDHLQQPVADVVQPAEAVQVGRRTGQVHGRQHNLDVGAVHQIGVTVDHSRHTLVEVGLAVEGHLDGLHGEVGVALVQHLPEGNLGVTRDVDILGTIAHEL